MIVVVVNILISILLKILSVCKDYHAFCERLYPLPLHLIRATSYLSYHNMWHLVLQKVQMLVLTCREWDLKCSLCSRILLPFSEFGTSKSFSIIFVISKESLPKTLFLEWRRREPCSGQYYLNPRC